MSRAFSVPAGGTYEWPLASSVADRFRAKVEQLGPEECWPWLGFLRPDGYGMIRNGTRSATSSRLAWVIAHDRPIPEGLHVLHTCDNRGCCNPAHLYVGTNAENVADKVERGRSHVPQPSRRGERHPMAKLTDAQVEAIRGRLTGRRGEGRSLAREFGVSPGTITAIRQGRR